MQQKCNMYEKSYEKCNKYENVTCTKNGTKITQSTVPYFEIEYNVARKLGNSYSLVTSFQIEKRHGGTRRRNSCFK